MQWYISNKNKLYLINSFYINNLVGGVVEGGGGRLGGGPFIKKKSG